MIKRSWQDLPIYQINTAEDSEAFKEIGAIALSEFDALRSAEEQETDAMQGKLLIPLTNEQQLKDATSALLLHFINWSTSDTRFKVETALKAAARRRSEQEPASFSRPQTFEGVRAAPETTAIAVLSKESAHFQSQLLGVEPMVWDNKCYPIEDMEARIQKYMTGAREELEAAIETDAELASYGKKHMNLVKQARLVEKIKIPGLEVPLPKGIKSEVILNFLKTKAPDLFTNWKALDTLFLQSMDKETFFDNEVVKKHLSLIDQAIKSAFERADRFLPDAILNWLDELKARGDYLMVRSTGAEDSKDVVNAGGNESIAYVKPEKESFCSAVGEVVRSYFSPQSLQNRVNAGQNPFEGALKLAVTAQQLIGEPIGGTKVADEIPISLVVFSNEPLYVGQEKFRAMTISATYGHGEAVVQTKGIPTDAVLVLVSDKHPDKLHIIYDNQYKPERLAPVYTDSGVELRPVFNPRELQMKPALNSNLLARLYHWAVIGEKFFEDDATDMEIVVKNGQIYPVQARAIGRPPMLPNFIDNKKFVEIQPSPILLKLTGDVVVAGKASVEIIDDPALLLFADTIEDAERLYRRGSRKLIVFSQEASENSHSVINFKTIGIPCLFVKNKAAMQKLITGISVSKPLVACVQTGSLSLWDRNAIDPLNALSEGFIVHPARVAQSLTQEARLQMVQVPHALPEEIKELLVEINRAPTSKAALTKLEVLYRHPWVQRIKLRRAELEEQAQKAKIIPRSVHQYIKTLEHLETAIEEFFSEIRATLTKGISPQSLQSLLRVKIVDRLMLNSTPLNNMIGQYSLLDVDPLFNAARYQLAYQEELPHKSHFVDLLLDGTTAFTAESFDKWQEFLLNLEPLVESGQISLPDLERFKNVQKSMRQSNNLPTFITCFFALNRANSPAPISIFRKILADASAFNDQFITHLLTQQKQMRVMHAQIDQFAQPTSFDGAWKALKGQLEVFSDPKNANVQDQAYDLWNQFLQITLGQFSPHASYSTVFQAASPMTRTIALQTMYELVELLDASIKALKLSPHFSEHEKLKRFKPMIQESMRLAERWAGQFTGPAVGEPKITMHLENYFITLQSILEKASDEDLKHLSPSFYFRVAGATLGSGSTLAYLLPGHLDDLFTLAHQNQLALLSMINKQLFTDGDIDKFYLPATIKEFASTLEKTFSEHLRNTFVQRTGSPEVSTEGYVKRNSLNKVGMRLSDQEIDIRYNIPIGQHSVQVVIRYDGSANKVTFRAAFFGGNEYERWGRLRECTEIWQAADATPFDIRLNDEELIIERPVDSNEMMLRNVELLAFLIVATEYSPNKEALVERVFKSAEDLRSKEKVVAYFLENPSSFAKQIYTQIINENRQLPYPKSLLAVLYANNQNMKTAIINFCQKKMLLPEMRIEDFLEEQTVSTAEKAMLHQIINAGLQSTEPFELTAAKFLIKDHQNNLWFQDSKHRNITNSSEAPLLTTSAEQGKKMFIEGIKLGRPEFIAAAIKLLLDGSPNLSVKYALSELSLALVEQERGTDEVIQWAKLAIVYPERPMIELGVDIFKALFTKGYAVDEAIDTLLIASNRRYLAGLQDTVKTSFSRIVKILSDNNLINAPTRLAKVKELKNQIKKMRGVDYESSPYKYNSID